MSTMRNLYVTLSFVMASGIISAQNQYTKTADKLFNRFEYVDAAKEYLKLAEGKSVVNNSNIEREGIVWRLAVPENNKARISFKSISNKFLLKNE